MELEADRDMVTGERNAAALQERCDLGGMPEHQHRIAGHRLWTADFVLCYQHFPQHSEFSGLPQTRTGIAALYPLRGGKNLGNLTGASVALPEEIKTAIDEVGFLASIPLWLVTILGSVFITVLSFVMILTVYSRFFRLYMYTALAPIPLSTFAGDMTSNTGRTFIKSYLGGCMEGAVIVLA